jgi:hypothetical protein
MELEPVPQAGVGRIPDGRGGDPLYFDQVLSGELVG